MGTLREAISKINSDVSILQGREDLKATIEYLNQKAKTVLFSREDPDFFAFSSWLTFGLEDIDFGWGKPIWTGVYGEVGSNSGFMNITVLKNTISGNGIEAWVTLDEKDMAI